MFDFDFECCHLDHLDLLDSGSGSVHLDLLDSDLDLVSYQCSYQVLGLSLVHLNGIVLRYLHPPRAVTYQLNPLTF